ncbi:phosphatidylinositol mannoside acyltransferase [Yinghuangia seranimata]|uniref:phosphatidylinositol mannoside acyltransferase n=1 Tax=Yinghuangia seranimata TaxID=408067 RepID=UPI00248C1A8E|nr:phosphatidylinositol mannoside acyltransferase [Yinghuangia seranimata]MDI2132704.1 phosphatidylinositol mannoside acyltransferase [Yinghuangia seranimata]
MKQRLVDAGFGLGWSVVKWLPEPVARTAFNAAADWVWFRRGDSVEQLEANLRRVLPDASDKRISEVTRAGMRSYLRYFQEAFRLPVWDEKAVLERMSIGHLDRLEKASALGKGVIFALPHMGNWDLAGASITARGYPFTTVAERLKPEALYERFLEYRTSLGMEVLPLTGGDANTFGVLARRLREGRLICLLADRDLTKNGIPVEFFGEQTRMPAGPAALSLQTGAALIPVTLAYRKVGIHATLHPVVPVPEEGDRKAKIAAMTQGVADAFAAGIRKSPQDWHMPQRLWLSDLDAERLAKIQGGNGAEPGGRG